MPANICNSSKLASNNLHPFNAFPASRPVSPPSEGASPESFFSAWAKRSAHHSLKMEHTSHNRPAHVLPELSTQDPYLSVSSDPEELDFQAFALRLTPVGGSPNHASSSPIGQSDALSAGPTIQTDYWAAGNGIPSSCASPDSGGFLDPSNIELNGPNWQDERSSHVETTAPVAQEQWTSAVVDVPSQQWLNAERTIPSPSSIQDHATAQNYAPNQDSLASSDLRYGPAQLTVTTEHTPGNGLVSASTVRGRSPLKSPIGITVESVSRGDSPVAGNIAHSRRPSRSSMHLSPGDMSSDSEDDGPVDDDHRSISSLSVARTNNGKWVRSPTTGHGGLAPSSRGNDYVQSPNDLKGQRERDQKNQHISLWLSAASTGTNGDQPPTPPPQNQRKHTSNRLRARSTGDRPLQHEDYFSMKFHSGNMTPGPGVLVHESEGSDDDGEDDSSVKSDGSVLVSPPADAKEPGRYDCSTPECYASLESTGPTEGFCLHPWQDCSRDSMQRKEAMQPGSSSAAMVAFEKRAKDIETASLAATVDNNSLFHVRSVFTELSITAEPKPKESVGTLIQRSIFSKLKRQASDFSIASATPSAQPTSSETPQRKESHSHRHRLSLSGRQHGRSPSVTNALFSMSGQMAAIGGNNAVHAVSPNTDMTLKGNSMNTRGRSRSEVPRPVTGLMALMTNHGGPPVANFFSSPRTSTETEHVRASDTAGVSNMDTKDEDDDEDHMDAADDKGLVMEFPLVSRLPVPTLEGFKQQIMSLNPRLVPELIERFAHEQVHRYERLVKLQRDHAAAITNRKCKSDKFCLALGGKAKLLEQRKTSASVEAGQTQFLITESINGGSHVVTEGSPTPAQFPAGVPIPPVSRLPAEFECSICYDVKKVHKPSDWSKHVQEDLQPFTCSFPDCTEPKSFKRKADWVRHENEKHRHLEWWICSTCDHKCYRKDNFVQHLVREHKMPDPKVKKGKGGAEGQSSRDRLSKLLDECRHETKETSQSEPCQFCGNILGNWKKLTVHLGKHMEQLAIPVLELAKQSTIAPGPAAPAGVSSGSAETYPLSAPFHGYQSTAGARLPTPQYPPSRASPPVNASIPYEMSLFGYQATISGTVLSTEPEPIADTFPGDQYSYISQLDHATLHPPSAQTHLPHHQNSVTYPPPYNAVHRPRTPDVNASVMPSYQLPQSSPYPAQASYPPYQHMAPTSPFPGSYTNSYSSQM